MVIGNGLDKMSSEDSNSRKHQNAIADLHHSVGQGLDRFWTGDAGASPALDPMPLIVRANASMDLTWSVLWPTGLDQRTPRPTKNGNQYPTENVHLAIIYMNRLPIL